MMRASRTMSRAIGAVRASNARVNTRAVLARAMRAQRARRRAYGGVGTRASAGETSELAYKCANERATAVLASALAGVSRTGDVICLHGAVGAGKSSFARAFIRAVFDDSTLDAPSPTYLVQQRYEGDVCGADGVVRTREVHHYDLYRLKDAQEIASMVDLGESAARATSLFEWSERLGTSTPSERLDVYVRAVREDEIIENVITLECGEREDDEDEEDEEEEDDEEVDQAYTDTAARLFRLSGRGGDWHERLRSLDI